MEAIMDERHDSLLASLGAFGSDFSRWPAERAAGHREALLAAPELRRAYEAERALDGALAELRQEMDRAIRQSGALRRVRERALARVPAPPLAGLRWRRIAAAVLVAGMLGGALDAVLGPPPASEVGDVAALEALLSVGDDAELQ
jgi:hypothetical protein